MLIKIIYWQSPPGISTFILFLTFQSLRKNKNSKIDFCFKKARKNCSIRILAKFVTQGFNEPRKVSQNYKYVTQLVNLVYIYCKLKKQKRELLCERSWPFDISNLDYLIRQKL